METFGRGAAFSLKSVSVVAGRSRAYEFYWQARLDGLMSREEKLGERMEEKFAGREDHLIARVVEYQLTSSGDEVRAATSPPWAPLRTQAVGCGHPDLCGARMRRSRACAGCGKL